MTDTIKIKLYVGTGFANCKHEDIFEINREQWEGMSADEQENLMDELAVDFRDNVIECSAWVVEEGDE